MTELYVWIIPEQYSGYDVGYTAQMRMWVLADDLEEAKKIATVKASAYPYMLKDTILMIINRDYPIVYQNGEAGLF